MESDYFFQYIIALLILAVMLLGFVWVVRVIREKGISAWGKKMIGNRKGARLKISEAMQVDAKRKLVIVECDQKEFLILIGGSNDIILDSMADNNFSDMIKKDVV